MGVVYKITFPDRRFYIGSTNNIIQRICSHYGSKNYVGNLIRDHNITRDELFEWVSMPYEGYDHTEAEWKMISSYRDDPLMLNKRKPNNFPKSNFLSFEVIFDGFKKIEPDTSKREFLRRSTRAFPDESLFMACDMFRIKMEVFWNQNKKDREAYKALTKEEK